VAWLVGDEPRRRVVLWGGAFPVTKADGEYWESEDRTWAWDGSNWSVAAEGPIPPTSMTGWGNATSTPAGVLLFGGFGKARTSGRLSFLGGEGPLDETWMLGATGWAPLAPRTSPGARMGSALGYDRQRGVVLLFGGGGMMLRGSRDTWAWDGNTWSELHAASAPPPVLGATMYFDEELGQLVLTGGQVGVDAFSDLWTWDGSTWRELAIRGGPPIILGAVGYHAGGRSLVRFGGKNKSVRGISFHTPFDDDTWVLHGGEWRAHEQVTRPTVRQNVSMAYDATNQELVLFGGLAPSGGPSSVLDDTWVLRPSEDST
jgi:hypothetical protein